MMASCIVFPVSSIMKSFSTKPMFNTSKHWTLSLPQWLGRESIYPAAVQSLWHRATANLNRTCCCLFFGSSAFSGRKQTRSDALLEKEYSCEQRLRLSAQLLRRGVAAATWQSCVTKAWLQQTRLPELKQALDRTIFCSSKKHLGTAVLSRSPAGRAISKVFMLTPSK